jgi:hypothetical protein
MVASPFLFRDFSHGGLIFELTHYSRRVPLMDGGTWWILAS